MFLRSVSNTSTLCASYWQELSCTGQDAVAKEAIVALRVQQCWRHLLQQRGWLSRRKRRIVYANGRGGGNHGGPCTPRLRLWNPVRRSRSGAVLRSGATIRCDDPVEPTQGAWAPRARRRLDGVGSTGTTSPQCSTSSRSRRSRVVRGRFCDISSIGT